ncbi:glycophorin-A isoform X2 [Saccopteryx bilineata]|uniref:glycophorin-A isoform X2 n=1 Tax=Saccopteryx bilineata TaxID=59482 RepID=UPI00338D9CDC
MYKKIIIGLLLSGYVSTSIATSSPYPSGITELLSAGSHTTEKVRIQTDDVRSSTPILREEGRGAEERGARKQLVHKFSEPVIIVIIFGVMAGILGIILLLTYSVNKLSKKSSLDEQPPLSLDPDAPLSSVETGNPASAET